MDDLANAGRFAIRAAKDAGMIAIKNFYRAKHITRKTKFEFVTDIDKKAEKLIISRIRKRYPIHHIMAEESGENEKKSEYMWVIDPIDGTHNFMHGIADFGVEIALAKNNEVILGVVYLPMTDELFCAEKGKGTLLNGKRIHVSKKGIKDETLMCYSCNFRQSPGWHIRNLNSLIKIFLNIRLFGSTAVEMSYVASGKAEAFVVKHDKPWDYAASALIVEEAGGKVTDLKGRRWYLGMGGFVASNGRFHDKIINSLK